MKKFNSHQYVTADLESPLAKIKADIHKMPFQDNTFDFVICNHVLEHVSDDIGALREIYRVLKRGGVAIVQVPFYEPVPDTTYENAAVKNRKLRTALFGQADHVRRYGSDYVERVRSSGMSVSAESFANELSVLDIQRFGVSKELIYVARKH